MSAARKAKPKSQMKYAKHEIIINELDRLYRFAYNRTHDAYRAEDITQDIILTAYQSYPRLRDKSRVIPWLWGIARNTVMQSYEHSREIPTDEIMIIDIAGVSYETPETEYLRKSDITRVRRAVSFLAKSYRDVCVLFYLEGKDYKTISNELGIPLSSVKWRLNQSKSQLREELEKMDYMENGYRKAIQLYFNFGGWVGKWNPELGNYDNADKVLEGLLAQNICLDAYLTPKTVTELSSDLGVAADYIEEALKKLVETQCAKESGNQYQTMFPIWDEKADNDVFDGNIAYAIAQSKDIIDSIYAIGDNISSAGFYGCDKGIGKLILFLIGYVCLNTEHNQFEGDKLPFCGNDKAWYILASKGQPFRSRFFCGNGINSSGSMFGLREYYFTSPRTKDNRSMRTEEQKAFYSLYLGEKVTDDYSLSQLIESGKVSKDGDAYKITVPVVSAERGEIDRLNAILAPVFEKTNTLQEKIYKRSCETVKKYIPKHIADQSEFFGSYCAHSILETALFGELESRGATITQDMATWYTVK